MGLVSAGATTLPAKLLAASVHGWLVGSRAFVDRIERPVKAPKQRDELPLARPLSSLPLADVLAAVADHYGVVPSSFAQQHNK